MQATSILQHVTIHSLAQFTLMYISSYFWYRYLLQTNISNRLIILDLLCVICFLSCHGMSKIKYTICNSFKKFNAIVSFTMLHFLCTLISLGALILLIVIIYAFPIHTGFIPTILSIHDTAETWRSKMTTNTWYMQRLTMILHLTSFKQQVVFCKASKPYTEIKLDF